MGIVEITTGVPWETFYVDDRNVVLGNDLWLYQETNGIWSSQGAGLHAGDATDHNLQRGGYRCHYCLLVKTEICVDMVEHEPDFMLY